MQLNVGRSDANWGFCPVAFIQKPVTCLRLPKVTEEPLTLMCVCVCVCMRAGNEINPLGRRVTEQQQHRSGISSLSLSLQLSALICLGDSRSVMAF